MNGVISQWLAEPLRQSVRLVCMLSGALLVMQAPALTHVYAVSLLQIAQDARRDIDQREADARQHYHMSDDAGDQAVIEGLRAREPSNAATLDQSVARATMFNETYARIMAEPPLLQPLVAAWDAVTAPNSDKLAVLGTVIETHVPQIILEPAAAVYGIAGLVLGSFVAQGVLTAFGGTQVQRTGRYHA